MLQIDVERVVELRHGAGQHDGAPRRVALHHGQPVLVRELADRDRIGVRGAMAGGELLTRQMRGAAPWLVQVVDAGSEVGLALAAQQDGDFEPLGGVGLADRVGAGQRGAVAAGQNGLRHGNNSLEC